MKNEPAQEAIQAALRGEWEVAIEINKNILSNTPKDIEALNRLARAYSETGNIKKAKALAKKVLKIDPFNSIASKCLQKWSITKKIVKNEGSGAPKDPKTFLEEPGKTKITTLLNLGGSKTLASLDTGDELKLTAHKHKVSVVTISGNYVGKLADDLSARLRRFIKVGNKYEVLVKSVEPKSVTVLIREIERSAKLAETPSFSTEKIDYISFTPPELVHKKRLSLPEEEQL